MPTNENIPWSLDINPPQYNFKYPRLERIRRFIKYPKHVRETAPPPGSAPTVITELPPPSPRAVPTEQDYEVRPYNDDPKLNMYTAALTPEYRKRLASVLSRKEQPDTWPLNRYKDRLFLDLYSDIGSNAARLHYDVPLPKVVAGVREDTRKKFIKVLSKYLGEQDAQTFYDGLRSMRTLEARTGAYYRTWFTNRSRKSPANQINSAILPTDPNHIAYRFHADRVKEIGRELAMMTPENRRKLYDNWRERLDSVKQPNTTK